MSARVTISVHGRAVQVSIRGAGHCTCGGGDTHEPDCDLLAPVGVDVLLDRGPRPYRSYWWHPRRRR